MEQILTFEQILKKSPFYKDGSFSIDNILINHEVYLAHLPKHESDSNEAEKLQDHLHLVVLYFLQLCNSHQLEGVIDRIIISLLPENIQNKIKLSNYIKKMFLDIIIYHDFGKINHLFQRKRMSNLNSELPIIEHNFEHYHSELGAYLFAIHHYFENNFEGESQSIIDFLITIFTYPILKHHSKYLASPFKDIDYSKNADFYIKYLNLFKINIENIDLLEIFQEDYIKKTSVKLRMLFNGNIQEQGLEKTLTNSFALFSLLKLNFSLLTASDYLATNEYMNGIKVKDFGVLSNERINEIYESTRNIKSYNKLTYKILENYQFQKPNQPSNDNLKILRQEMAIELINSIRANVDKNLFYIEAPTGGGKTNLSMLATAELLKSDKGLNKVVYVFPFTTLITQTYKAILETMGLNEMEITQIHSKAGFQNKDKDDDQYGATKRNYIDNLFVNFPFSLVTHIKFFDILKTNEKSTNYLLHRLSNSIVIIDELQSYNPAHWDKIIYFIRNYSSYFNIKFILMSATLPKLDKLRVLKDQVNDFVYLLGNSKNDYFRNHNFSNRVDFKFNLLEEVNISLENLADRVIELSKSYSKYDYGVFKPLDSVYTVIEFIFKKSASKFYQIIKEKNDFFDEIFVLSGTILEHRRRYIINYLKNSDNREKKILLITTQVVEAGVDIDMDLGFKNKSLIDSDEQLAGRINRNVNKKYCELFIFNHDESNKLYSQDKRYIITKSQINQLDYEDILKNKNFDKLYDLVLSGIDNWNDKPLAIGFNDYLEEIKHLNFTDISQNFKLIEQDNISIFVPIRLPITVFGHSASVIDLIFSNIELDFLSKANIYPDDDYKIDGHKVFELFVNLVLNKEPDFIKKKVDLLILQGIMSKFTFSAFVSYNDKAELLKYATEISKNDFGYLYLDAYEYIYNEEIGLSLENNTTIII